ncbi:hypothetical protein BS47DRAFT_1386424 [Hydnum rufescens UP504]|uniref:Uncharacterized protein n=1 Tax=Hydnum rufescens UP504 TaxID=1448309 RepID=A0A9P6DLV7_9AGAM|nr:hypothetical protein BS47DRAFT_1386424 [Hydnum rufescens UP504]
MHIAKQAQALGRFGTPLTSIANHAFATCRLLLLCVLPDGALLPPHPTEPDYRNASILTSALPVLSTILRHTSELLLKGPLDDASAMEQALGIVLTCITELGRSIEEARGAANADHIVEGIQSILSVKRTTALHDIDIVEGDGVDADLGPRPEDGGTPGPERPVLESPSPWDAPISNVAGASRPRASQKEPGAVTSGPSEPEDDLAVAASEGPVLDPLIDWETVIDPANAPPSSASDKQPRSIASRPPAPEDALTLAASERYVLDTPLHWNMDVTDVAEVPQLSAPLEKSGVILSGLPDPEGNLDDTASVRLVSETSDPSDPQVTDAIDTLVSVHSGDDTVATA